MHRLEERIDRSRIQLRPQRNEDTDFLRDLYACTRDDIRLAGLSDELAQLLINQQFNAQRKHYRQSYPNASYQLIEMDGRPVGRLYVNNGENEARLIDITLLPMARLRGVGTMLMTEWIESAHTENPHRPIRLRVNPNNPARRLYGTLGFELIEDEYHHWHMEWKPNTIGNSNSSSTTNYPASDTVPEVAVHDLQSH